MVFLYNCKNNCRVYREPDPQIGFIAGNWLTMGILQSGAILLICLTIFAIKAKDNCLILRLLSFF